MSDNPTLTYDGVYFCACCGMKLCKHWKKLLSKWGVTEFTALDRIEVKGEHNERTDPRNSTEVEG